MSRTLGAITSVANRFTVKPVNETRLGRNSTHPIPSTFLLPQRRCPTNLSLSRLQGARLTLKRIFQQGLRGIMNLMAVGHPYLALHETDNRFLKERMERDPM